MYTNVNRVLIGDGANAASITHLSQIKKGDLFLLKEDKTVIANATLAAAIPKYETVYIAMGTGDGKFILSSPIQGNTVSAYTGTAYVAPAEMVATLGYNGTIGTSIAAVAGTDYRLRVLIKDRNRINGQRMTNFDVNYTPATGETAEDVASKIVNLFEQKDAGHNASEGIVKLERVSDGTRAAFANNTTVTKGSKTVLCTAHGLSIGDVVKFQGISYLITAVETDSFTIDTIYQGVTETITGGVLQVETATVAGTIGSTGAGDIDVTITSALVTGSPLVINVTVANDDTATAVAEKIRTELNATAAVTAHYTIGGATTAVTLTTKVAAANDTSLNIALATGAATGLTAAPTSVNTTPGVASDSDTGVYTTVTEWGFKITSVAQESKTGIDKYEWVIFDAAFVAPSTGYAATYTLNTAANPGQGYWKQVNDVEEAAKGRLGDTSKRRVFDTRIESNVVEDATYNTIIIEHADIHGGNFQDTYRAPLQTEIYIPTGSDQSAYATATSTLAILNGYFSTQLGFAAIEIV